MTENEIQAGVNAYDRWYHTIPLPFDIVTPGKDKQSPKRWEKFKSELPALSGKTVLDVGAWDGYYSFMAEQEGADVLATDHVMWSGPGWGDKQKGFDFIKKVLGATVAEKDIDVIDICEKTVGTFDIVFFLNVLYHLENPYQCFQRVASTSSDYFLVETLIDLQVTKEPYMRFIPDKILNDTTNWFIPNEVAVKAMFYNAGFSISRQWKTGRDDLLNPLNITRMAFIGRRSEVYHSMKMI